MYLSPLRFYFTNWHGTSESESPVWRHSLSKQRGSGSTPRGSEGTPLLDAASLDYLFAQVSLVHAHMCTHTVTLSPTDIPTYLI